MKKVILLILLVAAAWNYYLTEAQRVNVKQTVSQYTQPDTLNRVLTGKAPRYAAKDSAFRCDGRQYCSQMKSRAEAEFFVQHCPDVKMDGDNDGVPCENDSRF